MNHRNLNPRPAGEPRRPRPGKSARPRHKEPPLLPQTDAGPRPISARQQASREGRITSDDIISRTVPRRAVPTPTPARHRRHVRHGETTQVRVRRGAARGNRRSIDYWGGALRLAVAALVLEGMIVLIFSPRFSVRETTVEGNTAVPSARILGHLGITSRDNLVRLPVVKLRNAVLSEPGIEAAEIHRTFPGTVRVVVHERQPWASVCLPDGTYYTIDRKLVPFRSGTTPEQGLPKVTLAGPDNTLPSKPLELGVPLTNPGLNVVSRCLTWASAETFPVEAVQIAPDGKLCLNRRGGLSVQLGSAVDLDKKLDALSLLLQRRPELRTGADIAYINLFAYDAPAIMPRSALLAPPTSAPADPESPPVVGSRPDPDTAAQTWWKSAPDQSAATMPPGEVGGVRRVVRPSSRGEGSQGTRGIAASRGSHSNSDRVSPESDTSQ